MKVIIVPEKPLWGRNNKVCMYKYVLIYPVVTTVDVVNTPLALFNCERHSMLFLPGSYGVNLKISADVFLSTDAGMSWHMVGLLNITCQQSPKWSGVKRNSMSEISQVWLRE